MGIIFLSIKVIVMKILSEGKLVNTSIVIALIFLMGSLFIAYQHIEETFYANEKVVHTHDVLALSTKILLELTIIEINSNNYLADKKKQYLNTITQNKSLIEKDLGRLIALTNDNQTQQTNLKILKELIDNELRSLYTLIKSTNIQQNQKLLSNANMQHNQILTTFNKLFTDELSLLKSRTLKVYTDIRRSNLIFLIMNMVGNIIVILSFLLVHHYMRERKRVVKEQLNLETLSKQIIDSSSDLIAAIDLEYKLIAFNQVYENKFSNIYHHEVQIGLSLSELLKNYLGKDEIMQAWRRALAGESLITVIKLKNNYFYEATYSPVKNLDGDIIGASQILRDITERKRIEQLKNEFISVVSQKLQSPLSTVRGTLGLLVSGGVGNVDAKAKDMLSVAYNNTEKLVNLIDNIIDIEKLESNTLPFDMTSLSLKKCTLDVISDLTKYARQSQIKIICNLPHDEIIVNADQKKLMQVIKNLIDNAIQFSPAGANVIIDLTTAKKFARFSISNEGEGIPDSFRDKLFNKFTQANAKISYPYTGGGLGLPLSKIIIERLGGKIYFKQDGKGRTIFYFDLPIHK